MSNFNIQAYEQKLRILRFDLTSNQNKEFKDFYEAQIKKGTDNGSYFFNSRSKIKGKHFRNTLDIIIQCLIDSFPKNVLIEEPDKEWINDIFNGESDKIIEEEKSGLRSVINSRGLQCGSSIAVNTVKAFEIHLHRIKSHSKDVLDSAITHHNQNIALIKQQLVQRSSSSINKTDYCISKIKDNTVLSIFIVASITVIALANVTDSLTKLKEFVFPKTPEKIIKEDLIPAFPGETGWIFVGYYNKQRFVEGPYVSVENTTRSDFNRFLEIGDIIKLKVSRKLIIVNYKNNGASLKLISPINAGIISAMDETGIIIPVNSQLIVRDISEGHSPNNPNTALWVRVVRVPK